MQNKIHFFYHREGSHIVTTAYQWDRQTGNIRYGMAFCSKKDHFSRERGRLIATGRLNHDGSVMIASAPGADRDSDVIELLRTKIASHPSCPGRFVYRYEDAGRCFGSCSVGHGSPVHLTYAD